MAQIFQTIAALVAIIFTPIGCWLAYKNIPKDRIGELKTEINFVKEVIIFLLVMASLSVLFLGEMASPDPITKWSVAKMCLYSSLAVLWVCVYAFSYLIKIGQRHSEIIKRHVEATEKIANRVNENVL